MLYAFIVRVCVCTSGEPLTQPPLSEAAAVERHTAQLSVRSSFLSAQRAHRYASRRLSDDACSFVPSPPTLLVHVGSHRSPPTPMLVVS